MTKTLRLATIVTLVGVGAFIWHVDFADGGRGRGGGGGGGRGGGGGGGGRGGFSGGGGGGVSRPSGGFSPGGGVGSGVGGGGMNRPSQPINRSPGISPGTPNFGGGPRVGGGPTGGLGARDGPGVVSPPGLSPGSRPGIGGAGNVGGVGGPGRPGVGNVGGVGGVGNVGGVGGPGRPGVGNVGGVGGVGNVGGVGGPGRPSVGNVGGVGGVGNIGGVGGIRPGGSTTILPGLGGAAIAGKAGDNLGRRQGNIQDRQSNIADRSQNLQNRMDQRQDFANQRQDQRQDALNDRHEDWQNWHNDYYGRYNDWYHGGWSDHWGDNWQHMWSDHTAAMVLGTTMWGVNRMNYWFGYGGYSNPYYTEPLVVDNTTIDYSQPLVAAPPELPAGVVPPPPGTDALPPGVTADGLKQFDAARAAFYSGNYQDALAATNKALASMPTDAVIHEFRALVLFALGNYRESAATLYPVLAVGPGWDWTTMSGLYPDTDTYTKQLRALEKYVGDNPKGADGHFLVAYHYLTCGSEEAAAKEYAKTLELMPNDTVTAQMLKMMGKSPTPAAPAVESDVKIDAAKLVGSWNSTRGKAAFDLTLGKDKSFTWIYQEGKKRQEVKGAYAVNGNVLALEPDAGGVMLAEVTEPAGGAFTFRTVGAEKNDPGLSFRAK